MKEIILLGNPNTGKTTLFNTLTKSSEHTGNWHGVTVDSKNKSYVYKNEKFNIVDLPGIYSLTPLSFEEQVAVDYLYSHKNSLVVNIVDINNLYRNMYLTIGLIEAKIPFVLFINETSPSGKNIYNVDSKKLEKVLGTKVVKLNAENHIKIDKLKQVIYEETINNKNNKNKEKLIQNNEKIENLKKKITFLIKNNQNILNLDNNYIALKCLEKDENIIKKINLNASQKDEIECYQNKIKLEEIAEDRYKNIDEILKKAEVKKQNKVYGKSKLDKFVLNKILCIPIFLIILLIIFYLTFFSVGKFLSGMLSGFTQNVLGKWLIGVVKSVTSSVIVQDFFSTAIVGGIGSIFSFLPQVVILFLCLGVLEDSGYLSRVAFSLDDIFAKVGLSGKSVYTLLMGFGCSTSACLTARTMENKNSQIKTAMLAPYMSCSAKLPIYAVIGSAFFGASNVFVVLAMYLLGVVVALCLSIFYDKTFLKSGEQTFILEFPPYRVIKPKKLLSLTIDNVKLFLIRIGSLLITVNIIVWILSSFTFTLNYTKLSGEASIMETLGKIIAPIFTPLGFGSWGAASSLIAGLVAKEIIVSSIGMINGITSSGEDLHINISRSLSNTASVIFFTPASAISYMVFCLLYSPCFATIGVLTKEIGKKWTFVSILVQFAIAYMVSLILYNSINIIMSKGVILFLAFAAIFLIVLFSLIKLISKKKIGCIGCSKCKKKYK